MDRDDIVQMPRKYGMSMPNIQQLPLNTSLKTAMEKVFYTGEHHVPIVLSGEPAEVEGDTFEQERWYDQADS